MKLTKKRPNKSYSSRCFRINRMLRNSMSQKFQRLVKARKAVHMEINNRCNTS